MKIQRVPDPDNFRSRNTRRFEWLEQSVDRSQSDQVEIWPGPLSIQLTPVEVDDESATDRARAVARIIKRQGNGHYHSTAVLREIAARMLDSGDLVDDGQR